MILFHRPSIGGSLCECWGYPSYKIAIEQYKGAGLQKCCLQGKLRHPNGDIEHGKWLIIGMEGQQKLAIWDAKRARIIHIPKDGTFLRAALKRDNGQWDTAKLAGWAKTQRPAYYFDGKKWRYAAAGDVVFGWVLGDKVALGGMRVWDDDTSPFKVVLPDLA